MVTLKTILLELQETNRLLRILAHREEEISSVYDEIAKQMKPEDYISISNPRRDLREQELLAMGYNAEYVQELLDREKL